MARTKFLHEKPDSTHIPSMLLDVKNGRPFEVEAIVGEVVRMAKDRNVAIPVRASFTWLLYYMAR